MAVASGRSDLDGNPIEAMTICMIGAGGFIGSHLCEKLMSETPHTVLALDVYNDKIRHLLDDAGTAGHPWAGRIHFHRINIKHDSRLEGLIKMSDLTINLAAICTPADYNTRPLDTIYSNFIDALPVVKYCSENGKRLIHFSTCEIYGKTIGSFLPKDHPLRQDPEFYVLKEDVSPCIFGPIEKQRWSYACAKQLIERLIYAEGAENGLEFTIVRPFNWIGPRMDFIPGIDGPSEGVPRVLACFSNNLLRGEPLKLVDGGHNSSEQQQQRHRRASSSLGRKKSNLSLGAESRRSPTRTQAPSWGCAGGSMKGIFKSKPKTPAELVRQMRDLLIFFDLRGSASAASSSSLVRSASSSSFLKESKREEKMAELSKIIRELKDILYGKAEQEPVVEACIQLTQEVFKENTLRLLIVSLPKLNLEARKDAAQVVANLQRQQVHSRIIASDYLEENKDLLDLLVSGYENMDIALHYGFMLRECIRHQSIAKYVLESEHMRKFFDYIQLPNFDISSDASSTFKELLTRHKSTVAEFLSKNYDWFFAEFNEKLLKSENYLTKRQSIKLLGDMLLDRSNSAIMMRYVCSKDNMQSVMHLLRASSKNIQIEAFHVFKLFAANQNKPPEIVTILLQNKSKLLRLFSDFKLDKEDEQFEADKAQVVKEIASL